MGIIYTEFLLDTTIFIDFDNLMKYSLNERFDIYSYMHLWTFNIIFLSRHWKLKFPVQLQIL